MRRLLFALMLAAVVNAVLTGLFCPVLEQGVGGFGHLTWETKRAVFVPLWAREGRPFSTGWLFLEVGFSLLLGFGLWFVYPQYKPPPPPDR